MLDSETLINGSRWLVRAGFILNRIFLAGVLLGMLWALTFPRLFVEMLVHPGAGVDVHWTLVGLRCELLVGIAMALATDRLFVALGQMIASTRAGDPFISINAYRLRTIGWALLVLQLLGIPGMMIEKFFPVLSSGPPASLFSPGGWLAVLMVFVLSRVFAAGAAMREELAGTV